MLITTISAESLTKSQIIALGRQLETNYRQYVFDCSGFTEQITNIMLVHQRNGDVAPYLVGTSTGTELVWTVTDTDTSFYGYGHGELRIYFANGMAKSVVFPTLVIKSITADAVIPAQLQSWYDAMIDYIDANSVTLEEVDALVEQYLIDHPVTAPVQSVNGYTGAVVLTAADVGALASTTPFVASFNGQTGAVTYTPPVSSVNSKTGAVALNAADVGALADTTPYVSSFNGSTGAVTYSAPVATVDGKTGTVTVLPTGGTTGQVLAKKTGTNYDVEWQTVSGGGAVNSVNGQTGTVVLGAADVGALPDTYTAPVTSVNTRTGAVTVDEVYWCTWGTTTSAEIETAITAGKLVCVKYNNYTYTLRFRNSATNHRFVCNYGGKEYTVVCQSGVWMADGTLTFLTTSYTAPVTSVNAKTGAVSLSASDVGALPDTYTAPVTSVNGRTGAVTGLAEAVTVENKTSADTSLTLTADKFYIFPTMSSLAVTVTATGLYMFRFQSGATATTLTVTGATMPDSFTVEANKIYEVNVYQGYAVVSAWTVS